MDATTLIMLLVILTLLGIPVIIYSLSIRDAQRIGRFLRRVACFGMVGIFGFIGVLMVLSAASRGSLLQAATLAALWAVPPLCVTAWSRHGGSGLESTLWAMTGLVCATSVIAATSAGLWWDFANDTGPYFQSAVPMTGVCLAIWALREPVRGGIAMIVLGLAPVLILSLAPGSAGASMAASLGPVAAFALAGAACLVGSRLGHTHQRPTTALPKH